jgi:hypothetical protein
MNKPTDDELTLREIIDRRDLKGLWLTDTVDILADMLPADYGRWRADLHRVFGTSLDMRDLDRAVDESRGQLSPTAARGLREELSLKGLPDKELLIVAEIESAIEADDLHAVYARIVPRVPELSLAAWMVCRAALRKRFSVRLGLKVLDSAVEKERRCPSQSRTPETTTIDQSKEWVDLFHSLYAKFGTKWFTANELATLFRDKTIPVPSILADVDRRREGSLERATGRRMSKYSGQTFSGYRLIRGRDASRKTSKWQLRLDGE